MNVKTNNDIPAGTCACGCGGKTKIVAHTDPARGRVKGKPYKFIHGHNMRGVRGANHPRWRGGRSIVGRGYVEVVLPPDHEFISMAREYKPGHWRTKEHRLVVAEALGRPLLSTEHVHHIDGDKTNNAINNLLVVNGTAAHARIHKLQAALDVEWQVIRKLLRFKRRRRSAPVPAFSAVGAGPIPAKADLNAA
jgi:HNH endonuclease